jgi:uncharacterized membrane protein
MLLDHTRDFVSADATRFDPTDLAQTSPVLFFTRWITHYCAPVFVFLAGTGAYLQLARGKSKSDLSKFLITRGLWLIFLEFTLVRLGFTFNLDYGFLGMMQVIWVIGVSMIILAGLIHLPLRVIAVLGIAVILLHNLLDPIQIAGWRGPGTAVPGFLGKIWIILHQPSLLPPFGFPGPIVFVNYNVIPWFAVMACGYAFGALYSIDAVRRRRILLILGGAMTALFVLIRAINIYGDPRAWTVQKNAIFTIMSFLNTTKYPPSLLYLLMTLGPAIIGLALLERQNRGWIGRALVTFGRVPLFFYLLQWYTAHGIAVLLGLLAGQTVAWQFASIPERFEPPPGVGFNLWIVYLSWIIGLLVLYPLCKWFASVKRRRSDWWLSYL